MKTKVEEVAEFVYEILEMYGKKEYNLSGIEDKQDIAWCIAEKIYNKYKKREEK